MAVTDVSDLGRHVQAALLASGGIKPFKPSGSDTSYSEAYVLDEMFFFAANRVYDPIQMSMPHDIRIRGAAVRLGLSISESVSYAGPKYGRINTIKKFRPLHHAILYEVSISTVVQALTLVDALR